MKVSTAVENVLASDGIVKSSGFKIQAGAQAFKLLSSGLYSDKVRAVLREIGCNAQDAHIDAGTPDLPIKVKLPNRLDTQFYIQDWGPGISEHDVLNLYSTYFASTKQASNDFTGAFGLGSKSPFSYTNNFSVVSVHGGRKRTFAIYLDNSGEPTTSLMSEEDPDHDWPHGVRVGFAVKPGDFGEFEEKAQDVFQYFRVAPTIKGSKPIKELKYRYQCEDYYLLTKESDEDINTPVVTMGSVAYPLNISSLTGYDKLLQFADLMQGLVLRLDIGDADITASRELIEYTPNTLKRLKEKLRLAITRFGKEACDLMDTALAGGWIEICNAKATMDEVIGKNAQWQFSKFAEALGVDPKRVQEYKLFIDGKAVQFPSVRDTKTACRFVEASRARTGVSSWAMHREENTFGTKMYLRFNADTVIAFGTDKYGASRAREAVKQGLYSQVIVMYRHKDCPDRTRLEIHADADAMSKHFRDVPVIPISDLPEYIVPAGTNKRKGRKKGWVPTLDPTLPAKIVGPMTTGQTLGDCPSQLVMVQVIKSAWGNNHVKFRRMDASTLKEDTLMDESDWENTWGQYAGMLVSLDELGLLGGLNLPREYAQVTSSEYRRYYLRELGWKPAHQQLKVAMGDSGLRDALAKVAGSAKVAAPEDLHHYYVRGAGWMTMLSHRAFKGGFPADIAVLLDSVDLLDTLREMAETTTKLLSKKRRPNEVPPVISHYENVCGRMAIPNAGVTDVKKGLTLSDMDTMFAARFPLSRAIDHTEFWEYLGSHPGKAYQILKFVFSMESKA